ncbi:MAG: hypothetical protein ABI130_06330 [Leifsonia sp.]
MRFTSPSQKTIVVVVLLAVDAVLTLLLNPLESVAGSIVLSILQFAGWYLASRVFRGAGEPVARARPWWRMTARPTLSALWAALYGVGALVSLIALFFIEVTLADLVSLLVQGGLAYLFFTSFRRLTAGDATSRSADPQRMRGARLRP